MFHLIFSDVCCKCVYLDIADILHLYCKCFIWMLHMFCNGFSSVFQVFCKCFRCMFQVFYLSPDICCKCSIWMLHMFIRCCTCCNGAGGWRTAARTLCLPLAMRLALSSSLPPFPSLHLATAVRAHVGKQRGADGPACGRGESSERAGARHREGVGNGEQPWASRC